MSLAERFADEISLEYSLIDRMRVRGHVLNLQTITMLRMFFQRVRGVEWIEPPHLQQLTREFVQFVEQYAKLHEIPLISAKPGESHVDQAAQYLDRVAEGVIHATALAKLNECLNGTLGQPKFRHESVSSPQPELQKHERSEAHLKNYLWLSDLRSKNRKMLSRFEERIF